MLQTILNKRFLFASLLVVLLAFTLAACDTGTGDDAALDEPGVVTEPLDDEGVVGDDDDILGDDEDIVGQDDDIVGDDDVLTDTEDIDGDDDVLTDTQDTDEGMLAGTDDVFTDDRIGMDEPGIMFDENDQFEATGRVETIDEDAGFFDLGFDDEPTEQVYLREGDTFDNFDFAEGDVVNVRGARENDQILADEIELGDATLFDDAGAMSGMDDDANGDSDLLADDDTDTDLTDDDDMTADVFADDTVGLDEPGIVFDDDDAFEATGTVNTIDENAGFFDLGFDDEPVESIYLREGDTFEDMGFVENDIVNVSGVREDDGLLYADSVEMDDGIFDDDDDLIDNNDGMLDDSDDTDATDGNGDVMNVPEELTDDSLGLATTGIVWWEDQFELTGNVETITDDYIEVTYPVDGEPVTEEFYLFSAPHGARTWADYDLGEDDVVSLAGFIGQSGRYYATEAVLDVGLFEEERPADSADLTDNGDMVDNDDDMNDDDDDMNDDDDNGLFGDDDSDQLGIQWDGDEFSLTGYIVGEPTLVNNELTIEADGEQYTIMVADTVVYQDDLLASDLMDGDLVEIEGVRDDAGDLWAHSIELEDDDGLSDS